MNWKPIDTAPQDGTHILVASFIPGSIGFGWPQGKHQYWYDVVHWFDDPTEPGFYASNYGIDQEKPYTGLTHWTELEPIDLTISTPRA